MRGRRSDDCSWLRCDCRQGRDSQKPVGYGIRSQIGAEVPGLGAGRVQVWRLRLDGGFLHIDLDRSANKQLIADHGSYVTVYRKQADGTWKATANIASSAVPPAALSGARQ